VKRPASYTPATLGSVARAEIIRIIVWCKDCRHQCGECGSHNTDFVLTGALRRDQRLL
jgi:hypothetical protein